jgi:hypothetical protein
MASGLLLLLGNILYSISIQRGDTRPNRVTWIIWTTIGFILLGSSYAIGAKNTLWLQIGQVISQVIITFCAFKYSQGKWDLLDRICLGGAGLSLLLWWQSGSPLVALSICILMDILGAVPTIRKIYHDPNSEYLACWIAAFGAAILNLLAIDNFDWTFVAFPLYFFILNITVVTLLTRPKWSQTKGNRA